MNPVLSERLTAEDFFAWVHLPENRDRRFELEEGQVVEMTRPGEQHGYVCNNVGRILGNFTFSQGKGYVCGNDTGVVLVRDPDTVRGPDLIYFDQARGYDDLDP